VCGGGLHTHTYVCISVCASILNLNWRLDILEIGVGELKQERGSKEEKKRRREHNGHDALQLSFMCAVSVCV